MISDEPKFQKSEWLILEFIHSSIMFIGSEYFGQSRYMWHRDIFLKIGVLYILAEALM